LKVRSDGRAGGDPVFERLSARLDHLPERQRTLKVYAATDANQGAELPELDRSRIEHGSALRELTSVLENRARLEGHFDRVRFGLLAPSLRKKWQRGSLPGFLRLMCLPDPSELKLVVKGAGELRFDSKIETGCRLAQGLLDLASRRNISGVAERGSACRGEPSLD
jgi:hypothetical protein